MNLELPEFIPRSLPGRAEKFADFLILTGQQHADVETKCSLPKKSCNKKHHLKHVTGIIKTCHSWGEILQHLELCNGSDHT